MPIREVCCGLVLKRSGKEHSKRWRKDILDQEIDGSREYRCFACWCNTLYLLNKWESKHYKRIPRTEDACLKRCNFIFFLCSLFWGVLHQRSRTRTHQYKTVVSRSRYIKSHVCRVRKDIDSLRDRLTTLQSKSMGSIGRINSSIIHLCSIGWESGKAVVPSAPVVEHHEEFLNYIFSRSHALECLEKRKNIQFCEKNRIVANKWRFCLIDYSLKTREVPDYKRYIKKWGREDEQDAEV